MHNLMKLFLFLRGQVLKPSEKVQTEMFCGGLAEILFRVADGNEAVFCLPGSDNCFEPSAHYGIDGVTEKVEIWKSNINCVTDYYAHLLFLIFLKLKQSCLSF